MGTSTTFSSPTWARTASFSAGKPSHGSKEKVGLAGDVLRGPIRPVGIPVRPQPVEVGERVAEVVGVAFQHGFDIGLTGDMLHAAGADGGLDVAGDAVVAEGLDRVA